MRPAVETDALAVAVDVELPEHAARKKLVNKMFALLFVVLLLVNFDSGCVPASLIRIVEDMELSFSEQGCLGALVYIGLTLSSMVVGSALANYSHRHVITFFTALNALCCIGFALAPNTVVLLLFRTITGFTQAFIVIFAPVWVDEFAPKESATLWMSLLQLAAPLGIMLGYVSGIFGSQNPYDMWPGYGMWRLPFAMQGVLMFPLCLIFLCVPAEVFDLNGCEVGVEVEEVEEQEEDKGEEDAEAVSTEGVSIHLPLPANAKCVRRKSSCFVRPSLMAPISLSLGRPGRADSSASRADSAASRADSAASRPGGEAPSPASRHRASSAFGNLRPTLRPGLGDRRVSFLPQHGLGADLLQGKHVSARKGSIMVSAAMMGRPMLSEVDMTGLTRPRGSSVASRSGPSAASAPTPADDEATSACVAITGVLGNGVFFWVMSTLSTLYFVVTGVQFWITPYCVQILHAPIGLVGLTFVIGSATAPTGGVIFGGWLCDRRGGYQGPVQGLKTLYMCAGFVLLAVASCLLSVVMQSLGTVMPFIFVMLFTGGAVVPCCTGLLMDCVPPELRPFSSAMSQMGFNCMGYAAAPLISGLVAQAVGGESEATGLKWAFRLVCGWSLLGLVAISFALVMGHRRVKREQVGTAAALAFGDQHKPLQLAAMEEEEEEEEEQQGRI